MHQVETNFFLCGLIVGLLIFLIDVIWALNTTKSSYYFYSIGHKNNVQRAENFIFRTIECYSGIISSKDT